MRKLASIRKISKIEPIPGADAIQVATVDGWKVVVKKDEDYKEGDLVVYLEVDSWIPTELAPFLSKGKEPREFNGVRGERLRTVKLRGQISQGLILPVKKGIGGFLFVHDLKYDIHLVNEDDDVTEILGIQKWEKAIPACLAGIMRGNFPSAVPKTDQERVQNIVKQLNKYIDEEYVFEVTEKLEGSSCTFFLDSVGEFHVCSRNVDLKPQEGNSFWDAAIKYDVEAKMRELKMFGIAVQGELIGPGIQGNIYGLLQHEFHLFHVYDANLKKYLDADTRRTVASNLELNHVPILFTGTLKELGIVDVDSALKYADGKSVLNSAVLREGVVFEKINGTDSFKAVSNQYLLGEK